jgi:aspartate kinase
VTFTCPQGSVAKATQALEAVRGQIGFEDLLTDDGIAKISLVGAGMRSHPGVSATFFQALADAGVNVEMISTSEIRISVVTRADAASKAVQALHTAFGLDADGEAVVYAGTGR